MIEPTRHNIHINTYYWKAKPYRYITNDDQDYIVIDIYNQSKPIIKIDIYTQGRK